METSLFWLLSRKAFEYYNKKKRVLGYSSVTIPSSYYNNFTILFKQLLTLEHRCCIDCIV